MSRTWVKDDTFPTPCCEVLPDDEHEAAEGGREGFPNPPRYLTVDSGDKLAKGTN